MAAAALRGLLRGESVGDRMERKPSSRRHVFVQTETGCVMGIELDRNDNAHTVKRRLQLALDVPTKECSLFYGDMVLRYDLSAVRNDSPPLIAKNFLHRSASTPCLSPTGKDLHQSDQSDPIEILGYSGSSAGKKKLIEEIVKAVKNGIDPIPVCGGLGGAYYLRNTDGDNVAIVKPIDEEPYAPNNPKGFVGKALGQPGLKRSVRVGETGFREVAAYLLDRDHSAKVPFTVLVKVTHSIFNVNDGLSINKCHIKKQISKIASLQQFIPHDFDASDHGTSSFPVSAVHRIGILDVRILNTDRHAGNLLVRKLKGTGSLAEVELIPIDHGLCLPESLEDPYFEWMHWPQASIPFSEDELKYIHNLDLDKDSDMLRMELPMIQEASRRVLVICTIFLKKAAAFGFCLAEIGEMMSREFRGHEEKPSELEVFCIEARHSLDKREVVSEEVKPEDDNQFQFDTDSEDEEIKCTSNIEEDLETKPFCSGRKVGNGRNPLSKLEESTEENEEEEETENGNDGTASRMDKRNNPPRNLEPRISKSSKSLKCVHNGEKSWQHLGTWQRTGYLAGTSSGNKSVNEQLPASSSFVKFADMDKEEWDQFLENFQEMLGPAFASRRSVSMGHMQRQRLGTSRQF
ncbi:hypothetical protein BT93_J0939 [Corymbia citriodora subsp. variegata]|nr:hypothetical protein BT93_J0939 [Corymbia citriodora subsp. variegata]KAF8010134.1 hypothetical protein BT93_J0939 [Corymbia citriodora subsp. variegata]KAF8010135.1 hypothetical protein BT93_J0939 [Corymbia citriodora subsp. variegata]KAF8010136.1 hypothetical protein BT93_J0939 [Corymbia citriodora subsp. variegata]